MQLYDLQVKLLYSYIICKYNYDIAILFASITVMQLYHLQVKLLYGYVICK